MWINPENMRKKPDARKISGCLVSGVGEGGGTGSDGYCLWSSLEERLNILHG